jgi:anti-sigma factor (TIGR02949 family)
MNVINFNSENCLRVRRQLDSYLSNELLVETTAEVTRHLETCADCARELESRTKVRDALRRAVGGLEVPQDLGQAIVRELEKQSAENEWTFRGLAWAGALALFLLAGLLGAKYWSQMRRGRQLVASVLRIGVADHIQCAVKGHNYPDIANPPDKLREKLGPQYSALLAVVQAKLPGFEVLEAHVCSIPGSPRKYVHFITRGHGTILSVILTRAEGVSLPIGNGLESADSGGLRLYEAHLDGMNAAGFEAADYLGFVVSDLGSHEILELARGLAPPLKEALVATETNAFLRSPASWLRRNS